MRSIKTVLAITIIAISLSGCATRGALRVACSNFEGFVSPLASSQLVRDIQSDAVARVTVDKTTSAAAVLVNIPGRATRDPLADAVTDMIIRDTSKSTGPRMSSAATPRPRGVLLLSGGGQWGAFGAGFLSRLSKLGGAGATDYGVITGVSTGGLQSPFVAIDDPATYELLKAAYAPRRQSEIVDSNPQPLAMVTGSMAGLKPLRKRIEQALCMRGDPSQGCPVIDKLAASDRHVYIGFVEASSGQFLYADAVAIAKSGATPGTRRNAQQCLTGVALVSAAMPVFFGQVRINDKTYYDGGVRLSVFEENAAASIDRAVDRAKGKLAVEFVAIPDLYVVRNGPTTLLEPNGKPGDDPSTDKKADALSAALRAEAIVVNQLEVGSIAALRLRHPKGVIRLVTADGYERWSSPTDPSGCIKPPARIMFDPNFMACLQRFGASKAERVSPAAPWIELSETP